MLGPILAACMVVTTGSVVAQDNPAQGIEDRGRMAAITLDSASLPGGYVFSGETFLTAEQVATGDLAAGDLTDAGFQSQYLSVYTNPDSGYIISSYVSIWSDSDAAKAGFEFLEDESATHPDGTLEDGDAGVGEAPRETTTGTYPDPAAADVTVSVMDTTFRVDRYLVGVSLETRDGTPADGATVSTLAGTLEARATAAVSDANPEGTDLALVPQAVPLAGYGTELQAGFLSANEVEQMYGLQGSALGGLTASWNDAIGLGSGDALQPYIAAGITSFGSDDAAAAIVDQLAELAPDVPGAEAVTDVSLDGAAAVAASSFPSQATGATEPDSFRIVAVVGSNLIVVDVQGAPSVDVARETAEALATAQIGCLGQSECAAPELPGTLTGS
jgi:hypothetical protein